jgi:hypothetical protein
MSKLGRKRFWRPLIGVVVAYAVAVQSLLIALGGFALAAAPTDEAPLALALCLHGRGTCPSRRGADPYSVHSLHLLLCRRQLRGHWVAAGVDSPRAF